MCECTGCWGRQRLQKIATARTHLQQYSRHPEAEREEQLRAGSSGLPNQRPSPPPEPPTQTEDFDMHNPPTDLDDDILTRLILTPARSVRLRLRLVLGLNLSLVLVLVLGLYLTALRLVLALVLKYLPALAIALALILVIDQIIHANVNTLARRYTPALVQSARAILRFQIKG